MPRTSKDVPQRQHNKDRMRRAKSWLARANRAVSEGEKAGADADDTGFACERFMFLWISFNAAYGYEMEEDQKHAVYSEEKGKFTEKKKFTKFLDEIVRQDRKRIIHNILWERYPGPVQDLLENKYVFRPFWESIRGSSSGGGWKQKFEGDKRRSFRELANGNVERVLEIVFWRLYELRNQIFHGGATFAEGWGQDQITNGSRIMADLVPVILDIMDTHIAENPDTKVWGKVAYPRINESRE